MNIANIREQDREAAMAFYHAAESVLERQRFSACAAEDNWMEWDKDDEDYLLMAKIKNGLAYELGVDVADVDNRIVCYEFLKNKYPIRMGHFMMVGGVLIDNCTDKHSSILEYSPYLVHRHVDGEQ